MSRGESAGTSEYISGWNQTSVSSPFCSPLMKAYCLKEGGRGQRNDERDMEVSSWWGHRKNSDEDGVDPLASQNTCSSVLALVEHKNHLESFKNSLYLGPTTSGTLRGRVQASLDFKASQAILMCSQGWYPLLCSTWWVPHCHTFINCLGTSLIFIYLTASGLSCGMQAL